MHPPLFKILLLAGALGLPVATAMAAVTENYWTNNRRGWHFYEDPAPEAATAPPRKPTSASTSTPPAQSAQPVPAAPPPELARFAQLQQALEQSRTVAIVTPTDANVRRYMALEAAVVAQASRFADVAQRVAWATPALDPTLQGRPVNAMALDVFEQEQAASRARAVAALGRDHVLFFFYRSDCPYCHAFAPALAAFQARHGIGVVAVSLDGGPMPGFPGTRPDNGIARTLNVTQVPAVFLAQPFTGNIAPVGFGILSESQLLERISTLASAPPPPTATAQEFSQPIVLQGATP